MEPLDAQEKRIRFGCGFVFGIFAGGLLVLRVWPWNGYADIGVILVSAVVCGVLAMKLGDRFWLALGGLRWWRR